MLYFLLIVVLWCELQQKQQLLGDKMDLSSYLLKPVQRISKYGLLLQDMLCECETGAHAGHERLEIQTALNIIQFQLRHGNNLLAMDDIQDCDVSVSVNENKNSVQASK